MNVKVTVKRVVVALAGLAAVGVLGALLVAWSGIVPIAASSGHWPVTAWFLHYTMRQSVDTHSMGIKVPPLDDPALVLRGAGHYATGCAPCHGAPGHAQGPIVRAMTPHPPYLPPKIAEWEPEELFWIVKHGVKFSAMPAWPALERDEEIWSVTAFLLRLPELDEAAYRELAFGPAADELPAATAEAVALHDLPEPLGVQLANCARCHGFDGHGRSAGAFPKLSGQTPAYLLAALHVYAQGLRHSGIMQPVAAELDEDAMQELAEYYAEQPPPAPEPVPERELAARGAEIALRGVPDEGIPSCASCHGPVPRERNPLYPALAGQYADYIAMQLTAWRDGSRGGTAYAHIMRTIAARMSDEQIAAVAAYYAGVRGDGSLAARE